MTPEDHEYEQERHRRRLGLMHAMGEANRMESRMHLLWALAVVLGGVALILAAMT